MANLSMTAPLSRFKADFESIDSFRPDWEPGCGGCRRRSIERTRSKSCE
ncbi:hypothetical protein OOT33_06665 [Sphingobium sp. DEHP117]|nr:hypothetical protein [Sphingobium sp. DEHP117]MDQ4420117.1 hypothetical protein [Sphingobium sp. DEHP117]